MPTICEPCPGKTNARSPITASTIAPGHLAVDGQQIFRYTRREVNSRRYVQSERARHTTRTRSAIEGAGLRMRTSDAVALAHALLSYPTWRTALTGPGGRRAPRLIYAALRSALL